MIATSGGVRTSATSPRSRAGEHDHAMAASTHRWLAVTSLHFQQWQQQERQQQQLWHPLVGLQVQWPCRSTRPAGRVLLGVVGVSCRPLCSPVLQAVGAEAAGQQPGSIHLWARHHQRRLGADAHGRHGALRQQLTHQVGGKKQPNSVWLIACCVVRSLGVVTLAQSLPGFTVDERCLLGDAGVTSTCCWWETPVWPSPSC